MGGWRAAARVMVARLGLARAVNLFSLFAASHLHDARLRPELSRASAMSRREEKNSSCVEAFTLPFRALINVELLARAVLLARYITRRGQGLLRLERDAMQRGCGGRAQQRGTSMGGLVRAGLPSSRYGQWGPSGLACSMTRAVLVTWVGWTGQAPRVWPKQGASPLLHTV